MFQSTRPRGARLGSSASVYFSAGFNPRAREGRDPKQAKKQGFLRSFNPRAREGRDYERPRAIQMLEVSIHAPARGATAAVIRGL